MEHEAGAPLAGTGPAGAGAGEESAWQLVEPGDWEALVGLYGGDDPHPLLQRCAGRRGRQLWRRRGQQGALCACWPWCDSFLPAPGCIEGTQAPGALGESEGRCAAAGVAAARPHAGSCCDGPSLLRAGQQVHPVGSATSAGPARCAGASPRCCTSATRRRRATLPPLRRAVRVTPAVPAQPPPAARRPAARRGAMPGSTRPTR